MRRTLSSTIFVLSAGLQLSSAFVTAQSRATTATVPAGVDVAALDRKTDPCADFYQFSCGGWIAANPLPGDRRSYGRFAEVQEANFNILRRVLESPSPSAGADARKASAFYAACMDERTIESKALTSIAGDLSMLESSRNPDDLPVVLAHLHEIGVPAFFPFCAQTALNDTTHQIANVDQGGLVLPDRDLYLKDDERSRDIRAKYAAHVERVFRLAEEEPADAAAHAKTVVAVETEIARASMDRVQRREPKNTQHRMTLADFQRITPRFDWKKYAGAPSAPKFQILNVASPEYFKAMNTWIEATPTDDVKAYLRWHALNASAEYLPKAFADADFDFFSRTLNGQQQ